MRTRSRLTAAILCWAMAIPISCARADGNAPGEKVEIRAWGTVGSLGADVSYLMWAERLQRFRQKFPHINATYPEGLAFGGNEYSVMVEVLPLMRIAGGIQADVLQFGLSRCDMYIRQRFLYPLDKHLEKTLGLDVRDGHLLELDEYLDRLKRSEKYESEMIDVRLPRRCWPAVRRECPYREDCPYCRKWGVKAASRHYHIWAFPESILAFPMVYRRDMFRAAGLPDTPPETMEQLLEYAKLLTDPDEGEFGLRLDLHNLGASTSHFLYSMGGRIVAQDKQGNWRCAFDSDEAAEAYYFVARLFHEPFVNGKGKTLTSVVFPGTSAGSVDWPSWRGGVARIGMLFYRYDRNYFWPWRPAAQFGLGSVPVGPTGKRGGRMRVQLLGIFDGLADDQDKLDAAWEWIRFIDGPETKEIIAQVFVEHGKGQFVQPSLLQSTGYSAYAKRVPKQWVKAFHETYSSGVLPPYGKNCQMAVRSLTKAIDQILASEDIRAAVRTGDKQGAKQLIRAILADRAARGDKEMLGLFTAREAKLRSNVAVAVAVAILVIFVLVFRKVFKTFAASHADDVGSRKGMWQFGRYKWAYILLIPAAGSIALWSYYPLIRGSVMAFQDYNLRGFSQWVGMDNFAYVLFSDEFWYAMWVSLKYVTMFAIFGFITPIVLAFLLSEIPRGKILFRMLYYLPAILSGTVVMFLWKGFYIQDGMINQVLNFFINLFNVMPGVQIEQISKNWLQDPTLALFCVLLPVVWVGVGPGCLIYLAALKTVPEELYEAADIDGASMRQKAFSVALPAIKSLIMINFIGVMVGQMKGGSEFVLAMTQGGPWTPYGATEVVGLHIYWQGFGFLRFGIATAMAWVLGSVLVGFTVLQLQRLSRMEFRVAAGGD